MRISRKRARVKSQLRKRLHGGATQLFTLESAKRIAARRSAAQADLVFQGRDVGAACRRAALRSLAWEENRFRSGADTD